MLGSMRNLVSVVKARTESRLDPERGRQRAEKENEGNANGDVEQGFFHPPTAVEYAAFTPKQPAQTAFGLEQNQSDQGHRQDDLDDEQA